MGDPVSEYCIDAWQRTVLFLDGLGQRGNNFFEENAREVPHVLSFDAELLIDGRTLERPVNCGLARIIPPADMTIDDRKRPFIVFDPRAGQVPGIGGMKHDSEIGEGKSLFNSRLVVGVVVGLFILLPVLGHEGWPYNHDGTRPLTRMAIVASHWRMGQLIPVWATSTVMGYGSPSPILYNKTGTYVSALLYLFIRDGKMALCATLLFFLIVGFLGAAACVRLACGTVSLLLESFAGFMLVSCNYTTTDWLVRGDDAEFAAMMLAPWLFLWCLRLLGDGLWSPWLGALLAVMALTHSVIGLFCLIPIGLAVGLAVVRWRRRSFAWCPPIITSIIVFWQ